MPKKQLFWKKVIPGNLEKIFKHRHRDVIILFFLGKRDVLQDRCSVPDVSVRFERRYIEMDEEILSTITDIDGKPLSLIIEKYFHLFIHKFP